MIIKTMGDIARSLYLMGFGLFLLFLAWWQFHTGKTGGRVLTSEDLKTIKKEENPTAFKIRAYMTLFLGVVLIILSIVIAYL